MEVENGETDLFDYKPVAFLRCHSRKEDPADVQTQVWDCAFEPSLYNPLETASVVATCGGNSVCFIDCESGQVLNKFYASSLKVLLYALAWTVVDYDNKKTAILVAGGSFSTLYGVNRVDNKCILEFRFSKKKTVSINSVLFHPTDKAALFCGMNDGVIKVCRLEYSEPHCQLIVLEDISPKSEVFDMSIILKPHALLTSCNDGLFAFPLTYSKKDNVLARSQAVKLELPERGMSRLVDSVEVVGERKLAVKCALHGCIYLTTLNGDGSSLSLSHSDLTTLPWSDTDNYFMRMGYSSGGSVLCCGDDKGCLWLYDLERSNEGPVCLLPWPCVTDHFGDRRRKLHLQVYDIVVAKVVLNSTATFAVAVTNNNMVCIWASPNYLPS